MKIVLVQHKDFINGSGGAEKMCCFLANGFHDMGYTVEIATNEDIIGAPMFPLNKGVTVTNIFDAAIEQVRLEPLINYAGKNPWKWLLSKIRKKRAKLINKRIRRAYDDKIYEFNLKQRALVWNRYFERVKPALVVTMSLESVLEITYLNSCAFPIVNSVNGRPDYDYASPFWNRDTQEASLLKAAYTKLAGVQVLFASYEEFIPTIFKGKCFVIPNPVPQPIDNAVVNHFKDKDRYTIVNIGRLDNAGKQQPLAIEVFAQIADSYLDWDLVLWGIGADRKMLQSLIEERGMEKRIFLKGFTENPLDKLKESDVFVFPSKYEGFPLALTEAMSVGLPVLGLRSCSGVNELINHEVNGYLVEGKEDLQTYLVKLIESPSLRQELGQSGKKSMGCYAPALVLQRWSELLTRITN